MHPSALTAKAIGVLHAFGYPLLWMQRDASAALSRTRILSGNTVTSQFWSAPTMAWTIYANASSITTTAPAAVTVAGSGLRRIYAANSGAPNPRVHLEAKLTAFDAAVPGFFVLLNGCVSPSDVITCGWYVTISHTNKSMMLGMYTGADSRSAVQETCNLPATFTLASTQKLMVQIKNDSLYFNANYATVCSWPSLTAIANKLGITKPTGTFAGLLVERTNRLAATTAAFW